ncbi:MAG TPA: hypothetical protein PLE92_10120, partial [Lentisphaeria bacterium]|nr:hypothetical protein [Lentisphaeria bacterium]
YQHNHYAKSPFLSQDFAHCRFLEFNPKIHQDFWNSIQKSLVFGAKTPRTPRTPLRFLGYAVQRQTNRLGASGHRSLGSNDLGATPTS